ncbi:MAG: twin-arginine translocase TatA/TatE family subunit [Actinobacteria bacterium]|jgi:sec-independent protein translocase protein TatA|nr:twin-arginine translocase TatA/TatE family subunit [Actinomycetota bacterium]MCL6094687.1 twin-arginine translocase TatA/TatE family subunit [Actinomycetota bacterium]
MPTTLLADIFGPDVLIVLIVIAVLFGGSQLPKLARALGSASHEFKKGVETGLEDSASDAKKGSNAQASETKQENQQS